MTTEQLPDALAALFKQKFLLDDQQLALLASKFWLQKIPKKHFYLKQGDILKSKAFIKKGAVRTFYYDDNAKENILFFRFENSWLGDIESYHQQVPSKIKIQALEDTELLLISKPDFEELETKIPTLQKWYSLNAVKMYASLFNKLVESKMRTPEQKYLHLLEHEPQVF
jgi:CRP-like cAMP-binding protein